MWKVVFIKKNIHIPVALCTLLKWQEVYSFIFSFTVYIIQIGNVWRNYFLLGTENLNARKQHVDCSIKVPQLSSVRPLIVSFTLQNRELQIMRKLEHHNIVKLKYFFYSAGEKVWCFVILWWILYSLWYYFKIYNK